MGDRSRYSPLKLRDIKTLEMPVSFKEAGVFILPVKLASAKL
jgi:hypothetical protein